MATIITKFTNSTQPLQGMHGKKAYASKIISFEDGYVIPADSVHYLQKVPANSFVHNVQSRIISPLTNDPGVAEGGNINNGTLVLGDIENNGNWAGLLDWYDVQPGNIATVIKLYPGYEIYESETSIVLTSSGDVDIDATGLKFELFIEYFMLSGE